MAETLRTMTHDMPPDSEVDITEATARIDQFLQDQAPALGRLMGIPGVQMRVGEGWSTDLKTGETTLDPTFFIERGYTADMASYAGVHEFAAHLREVLTEPELTREVTQFASTGEAESIFHNIFSDIAGNNRIHAVLPRMAQVAERLYSEKLFPETDYVATHPRHLQFLYKLIRQEMLPGSETAVLPEVDVLLDEFRNYLGTGQDLLRYSTQYAKSPTELMTGQEKFAIWTKTIYPRWRELLELDEQDPQFQQQQSSSQGEPSEGTGKPDFSKHYEQYRTEHHPEPMSEEEHEAIEKAAQEKAREKARNERQETRKKQQQANPTFQRDAQLRRETGHGLAELQAYNREADRLRDAIDEMRDIYRSLLDEHIGVRRRLRGGHTEGAILTPDRLAQTVIDIRRAEPEPKAFSDYERRVAQRELSGKSDYVFVFDRSGSMRGEKAAAAASSAIICTEALAGMQRDIEQAQEDLGATVDVDIRTAIYTFNDEINNPKPLSHSLNTKERLDTFAEVRTPGGDNADSHVLQTILDLPPQPDRSRILVVVSDGEADNPSLARVKVEQLRRQGWKVYGVSIGSDAAVRLYAPHSRRVDDPTLLPDVMRQLVEETL